MKKWIAAAALTTLAVFAHADASLSVEETNIGVLMENPQAKAVLEKHLPKTVGNEQFTMAYGFTLTFIKTFDQVGELTDENLAAIDAELKALPAAQ